MTIMCSRVAGIRWKRSRRRTARRKDGSAPPKSRGSSKCCARCSADDFRRATLPRCRWAEDRLSPARRRRPGAVISSGLCLRHGGNEGAGARWLRARLPGIGSAPPAARQGDRNRLSDQAAARRARRRGTARYRLQDDAGAVFSRCPASDAQGRRPSTVGAARDRGDPEHRRRIVGACRLIFVLAAAVATAAPCPNVVTPEALVCRALEAQKREDNQAAAQGFEEAARASSDKDPKAARMYAAAGNLWIAANQPGKAALDLDRALALPGLEAEQRGEALLDRARAAEAQNDLKTARARLNEARATIAEDPFYWYFSAALAIRENDLPMAQSSIGQALKLAPSDPTVL